MSTYNLFYPKFPDTRISKLNINNLKEMSIEDINKLTLNECILELPIYIRNKIGIYCIKAFWKLHLLKTPLIPIWYKHQTYVKKQLHQSIEKNIHFTHLNFNILPNNKKYILGCQCDYCKSYFLNNRGIVLYHILRQITNPIYFNKFVPESTSSNWNSSSISIYDKDLNFLYDKKIFNSLYDILLIGKFNYLV